VKFKALAVDYDGTIAQDGILDPDVRIAIAEARTRGIIFVLVTGRVLVDLERAAGELDFADAIVAENGAVLEFPNRYSRLIGSPAPVPFLDELRQRGIPFTTGQCVVEADAKSAQQILAVIRELELPLMLLFNRSRLMVLPQGVSKSVGLRQALSALHLSRHNTIAIGDAENDHDLLATCELGVAVAWGSKSLQRVADQVLEGNGPAAVAPFIRQSAHEIRLPPTRIGRYSIALGKREDGSNADLSIRGRNLLVSGDSHSGKSWVTGLTCERLILQGYSVCVVDPEGDYRALDTLPGIVVFGGEDPPPQLPDLARALRHPEMGAVIDLSHVRSKSKIDYLYSLLPMLASLRRATGLPHRIVIDEAHYFLHGPHAADLLDLSLNAYTLVTYRVSDLNAGILRTIEATIVNRTSDPNEVQALHAMAGGQDSVAHWTQVLEGLAVNQAVILPNTQEAAGRLCRVDLSPRITSHVRHKAKYLDVQLIEEQGFVFTQDSKPCGTSARTLKQFISLLRTCPWSVLEGHMRQGDFSRWINNVFHDRILADNIRKLEERCRAGDLHGLSCALVTVIQERYEVSPEIPILD